MFRLQQIQMGRLASAARLSRRWFGGRKVESTMSTQLQSISQTATLTLYVTVPVVTMRHRNVRTSAKVADSLPPNREDTGGVPRIPFQNPRLYIRVLELTKNVVDGGSLSRTTAAAAAAAATGIPTTTTAATTKLHMSRHVAPHSLNCYVYVVAAT